MQTQVVPSAKHTRTTHAPQASLLCLFAVFLGAVLAVVLGRVLRARADAAVPVHSYVLDMGHEREWQAFGGNWLFHDNLVESRHSDDRGAKLLAGSPGWENYTLTADLRFDSERGDTGVVLRSRDEQNGVDTYNGYYVGLRMDGGALIIGRSNYGWVEARPVPLAGGFRRLEWYRLRVTAYKCNIAAMVQNLATSQTAWVAFEERKCAKTGRIGLRSVDVDGAWRNIRIAPASMNDYFVMQHHTDSVERPVVLTGPPWWTPWHIGEIFVGTLAVALLLQLSYYRFQQWKTGTIMQERQRLAHDIHDTMAQNFAGLGYHIQGIRSGLIRGGLNEPQQIAEQLSVAYQLIRRCHAEASETISILGSGFFAAQEELSEILSDAAYKIASHGIVVHRQVTGTAQSLNLRIMDALQHIGREAIANAVTHSSLNQLTISVHYQPRRVELLIQDDGIGFEYGPETQGFGISGMQKRTQNVRGTLRIASSPGTGTQVHVVVALHPERWHEVLLLKLERFWAGLMACKELDPGE